MYVKVAKGRAVRDPVTRRFVPAEGREVPDNDPFWQQCLRQGDIVVTEPPKEDAPKTRRAPKVAPSTPSDTTSSDAAAADAGAAS
ncbi:DUF2635 domain-containing protein [Roseomonas chloroacetimidivorans]|uniref:DUF2635 domain-containing protein n=1 Tax=Roseomonas chloroacetimidivorans TaxID=1766656 RepID=UPI003C759CA3